MAPELVRIDGAYGEGGGQILRTSIALSALLRKPVEVYNIRAKRSNPGLRPQHMAAVRAVAQLFQAEVEGLREGSSRLLFVPREPVGQELRIDVGTAGSITLILQALLPAAGLAGREMVVELRGGTDVRWSPTTDYFRHVVLPLYRKLGLVAEVQVVRRGYYPKGGGLVRVHLEPTGRVRSLSLLEATRPPVRLLSVCSRLPRHVAERQRDAAIAELRKAGLPVESARVEEGLADSPGSSIVVWAVDGEGCFIGGDAIGERGKPAERVGAEAARMFLEAYRTGAPLDPHIGDMVVTLLAVAEGRSAFRVARVTQHLTTNLEVVRLFTGREYRVVEEDGGTGLVEIL